MPRYNESDWCDYTGYVSVPRESVLANKKLRKVRCPACRKRMTPRTLNAEPFGNFDAYYVIPRHKKPYGKRRAVTS